MRPRCPRRKRFGMAILSLALSAGCASGGSAPHPNADSSPGLKHPEEFQQTRQIRLPSGRAYALAEPNTAQTVLSGPAPLVIALHGLYEAPASFASESRLTSYSGAHHFVLAYGEGRKGKWNAGSCCAGARTDDMQYLVDVLVDVSKRASIDRRRVYVVGFSAGGMLALKAVCERPDLFAAAGVMSGALMTRCAATPPRRTAAVHVRQLHGAADPTVPANGGRSPSLSQTFPPLSEEKARLPAGSTLRITLVPGLEHHWANPDNSSVDATNEIWTFLQDYKL